MQILYMNFFKFLSEPAYYLKGVRLVWFANVCVRFLLKKVGRLRRHSQDIELNKDNLQVLRQSLILIMQREPTGEVTCQSHHVQV